MRRFIDILGPLGLLLIAVAWGLSVNGKPLPGRLEVYVVSGVALLLANIFLRYEEIVASLGMRQIRYGGNTFLLSLVVLGILAAVNYLTFRHTKRWDLTKNQRNSLSEQTKKVIQNLKDDITIMSFQQAAEMTQARDRMKEYVQASPHLKLEFVNPMKDPSVARKYDVTAVPSVVVLRGDRHEKAASDSEQDVANALIKVTRDSKKTVCFAVGEGERDPDASERTGYSAAKSSLVKSQYDVKSIVLLREGRVPAECTVLIVAAPEKDLLVPVVDSIRTYVKGGGKALLMVEPEFKESYPNFTGLLKEWNIETRKDVVVDASGVGELFGAGPITPLANQYPYHEITRDFRMMTAYHEARSMTAGKGSVEGVTAQNIVETAPQSWSESDLTLKDPVEFNEGKDQKGPVSLAVAVTVGAQSPKPASPDAPKTDEAPKKEGRVVAVGDSDFASNTLLGFQGNKDLFLNMVAWLSQDFDLISIRPREPEDQRMLLTRTQMLMFFLVALVILPGFFVVLGTVAWWRRR